MSAADQITSDAAIEEACRGMYGKNWDGPPEKMPGPEMKKVWRDLARKALAAVAATLPGGRKDG